ncbi:MAG: hypothetical protein U1E73_07960 [Planctomycetota bacterium]
MSPSLLTQIQMSARALGAELFGVVDAAHFDAGQPKERRTSAVLPRCGAVVVFGSGGKGAQRLTAAALQPVLAPLRAAGLRAVLADPARTSLSFARLAEAAGFGTVSPVTGMLLHPEFGPWVRVHGAVLVEGRPFGAMDDSSIIDSFQPCCRCRMPCLEEAVPAASCHIGVAYRSELPAPCPAPRATGPINALAHVALRFVPRFLRR